MLVLYVLSAALLLIAMFLTELGLALVNCFVLSLNVLILAISVESLVASLLLMFYLGILMERTYDALLLTVGLLCLLHPMLKTP